MHKMIRSSAMLLTLSLATAAAGYCQAAQDSGQSQGQGQHQFHHRGGNPEFETRMLTKRLGLSPEQALAVEPILAEQHEQMKALRPAAGTRPDYKAMQSQRQAIWQATEQKLDTVLNQDQQAELAKMHEHHGGPHGYGGGNKPSGSGA